MERELEPVTTRNKAESGHIYSREEVHKVVDNLLDKGFRLTDWHIPMGGHARVILEGTATPDIAEELDYLTRKC